MLRNLDHKLHKMFLTSAKEDESVDALRYRLIKYHYSSFWNKSRLILLTHLVTPTGHIRDSPDQIAHAIAKYTSTMTDIFSGRLFGQFVRNTMRTIGNATGLRRRSSSHSWLTKKAPGRSVVTSTHKKTTRSSSHNKSRKQIRK